MLNKEILNSHSVSVLKKEMSKVKKSLNYSKLNKSELIDLMLKNKEHFQHIKMAEKKEPVRKVKFTKKEPVVKAPKKDNFSEIIIEQNAIPRGVFTPKGLVNFRINQDERKKYIDEVLKNYKGEKSLIKNKTGFIVLKKIDEKSEQIIGKGELNNKEKTMLVNLNAYRKEILQNLYYDFKERQATLHPEYPYEPDNHGNRFVDKLIKKGNQYLKQIN